MLVPRWKSVPRLGTVGTSRYRLNNTCLCLGTQAFLNLVHMHAAVVITNTHQSVSWFHQSSPCRFYFVTIHTSSCILKQSYPPNRCSLICACTETYPVIYMNFHYITLTSIDMEGYRTPSCLVRRVWWLWLWNLAIWFTGKQLHAWVGNLLYLRKWVWFTLGGDSSSSCEDTNCILEPIKHVMVYYVNTKLKPNWLEILT